MGDKWRETWETHEGKPARDPTTAPAKSKLFGEEVKEKQPETRTTSTQARDKKKGDVGNTRRRGRRRPKLGDKWTKTWAKTNEGGRETHEGEAAEDPTTETQAGRQMKWRRGSRRPDYRHPSWETNEGGHGRQMKERQPKTQPLRPKLGDKWRETWEIKDGEAARDPTTENEIGRQMIGDLGDTSKKPAEDPTTPPKLGNKWKETCETNEGEAAGDPTRDSSTRRPFFKTVRTPHSKLFGGKVAKAIYTKHKVDIKATQTKHKHNAKLIMVCLFGLYVFFV